MKNPHAQQWIDFHNKERKAERELARMEAQDAESRPVLECGKCGHPAYYRPGVGSHQCSNCRAVLSYSRAWI